MKILIIEDSIRLLRSLSMGLRKAGFKVDTSNNGTEGLYYIESNEYDVVILDLMLPELDGLSILKHVRKNNINCNILILSAKDTVSDRVKGLEIGADDYLIKPFAFEELLARINTLIRRRYSIKKNIISFSGIDIDLNKRLVYCDNEELKLPPREYSILEYLAMNKGKVISRTEIEEHIYDINSDLMSNVVDAAICNLRKIMEKYGKKYVIKTSRGKGFIID